MPFACLVHRAGRRLIGLNWTVSEQKVRAYLLNTVHPVGGPKARFFLSRGFSVTAWQVLTAALRQHPIDNRGRIEPNRPATD